MYPEWLSLYLVQKEQQQQQKTHRQGAEYINICKCGIIDDSSLQFLFSEEQEVIVNQGKWDLVQTLSFSVCPWSIVPSSQFCFRTLMTDHTIRSVSFYVL